jgi:aryl-alcohol dehydrogenase-like predicted oxidoreductase
VRYRLLGRSGLRVSELWLGAMTFGEDWGWGAPEATCERMLDLYLDRGGNVVDTADWYTNGASEEMLGRIVGDRRDRLVLSTKYSINLRPEDPNGGGNHRRRLVEAVDGSLRRLRTDRIDVLWVHFLDELTPVEETMRALDDQVRLGKVLYVAASDWPAFEVARANTMAELRDWSPFVALQTQYSLLERTSERELLRMAQRMGISVVAWSPLAKGLLSGKYLAADGAGRVTTTLGSASMDPRTEAIVRETVAVAEELGATPSQVAIAWLLARRPPVLPIVGATSEAQLEENLGALDLQLTAEQAGRLDAVSAIEHGFPYDWLATAGARAVMYGPLRERVVL